MTFGRPGSTSRQLDMRSERLEKCRLVLRAFFLSDPSVPASDRVDTWDLYERLTELDDVGWGGHVADCVCVLRNHSTNFGMPSAIFV